MRNILFGCCKGVFFIPFYSTFNKENNTIKFLLKADDRNRIVGVIVEKKMKLCNKKYSKLVLSTRKINLYRKINFCILKMSSFLLRTIKNVLKHM